MTTSPFELPDYTSQTGTEYPINIDHCMAIFARMAASFAPQAQDTPNMTVHLGAGVIWNGATLTEVAMQNSSTLTAPVTHPRIDLVVVDATTGAVSVIGGSENASPVPPALTDNKIPVAKITLTVGMTSITNADMTDYRPPHFMRRATQAQAEAGIAEGLLMDPLRTAQAIEALAGGALIDVQRFPLSDTWYKPAGCKSIEIDLVAGGGGGGGVNPASGGLEVAAGGGGGGGTATTYFTGVIPSTLSVTIGSGGSAGNTSGSNGGNGGSSSVGSLCAASGGLGGTGSGASAPDSTHTAGGDGGVGTTGDGLYGGEDGGHGFVENDSALGGAGGSSTMGGGGRGGVGGYAGSAQRAASAGNNYGAGGGGAAATTGTGTAGAAGRDGYAIIRSYK